MISSRAVVVLGAVLAVVVLGAAVAVDAAPCTSKEGELSMVANQMTKQWATWVARKDDRPGAVLPFRDYAQIVYFYYPTTLSGFTYTYKNKEFTDPLQLLINLSRDYYKIIGDAADAPADKKEKKVAQRNAIKAVVHDILDNHTTEIANYLSAPADPKTLSDDDLKKVMDRDINFQFWGDAKPDPKLSLLANIANLVKAQISESRVMYTKWMKTDKEHDGKVFDGADEGENSDTLEVYHKVRKVLRSMGRTVKKYSEVMPGLATKVLIDGKMQPFSQPNSVSDEWLGKLRDKDSYEAMFKTAMSETDFLAVRGVASIKFYSDECPSCPTNDYKNCEFPCNLVNHMGDVHDLCTDYVKGNNKDKALGKRAQYLYRGVVARFERELEGLLNDVEAGLCNDETPATQSRVVV